jgi:mRNA interferase MazF
MAINRFEIYLVNFGPAVGSEIRKTRPCLVVSPDDINHTIRTVIIAPLTTKGQTTKGHAYPTRIPCRFKGKNGRVVLDQIRTVDRSRLIAKLGRIGGATALTVLYVLREMFEP